VSTTFFTTAISDSFHPFVLTFPVALRRKRRGRALHRAVSCRRYHCDVTTPRERTEEIERQVLSDRASLAANTKGRDVDEPQDDLRTVYQRDRDRIVHTKAFRRLKHKTQVFLSPEGDHYRVRLTHTLDVSQIARTVARALRLNEDLAEAIALGHDLGHTPFGHLGEQALTPFLGRPFRHSEQSLRVVDHLENDGKGLNLTWEVRDGIVNHPWSMPPPSTLEAQIVRYADRIAYLNHDIDDALRAGVLTPAELPSEPIRVLGDSHARRINTLVTDLVASSEDQPEIGLSRPVFGALDALRDFMFEQVYLREDTHGEHERATRLIRELFQHFLDHPDYLPEEYHRAPGDLPTRVADYISGMTDRYAIRTYERLFLPRGWLHDQG
jgi:dGTPase